MSSQQRRDQPAAGLSTAGASHARRAMPKLGNSYRLAGWPQSLPGLLNSSRPGVRAWRGCRPLIGVGSVCYNGEVEVCL